MIMEGILYNNKPLIIPTSLAPSPIARVTAFLCTFTKSTIFFYTRKKNEDEKILRRKKIRVRWAYFLQRSDSTTNDSLT